MEEEKKSNFIWEAIKSDLAQGKTTDGFRPVFRLSPMDICISAM